MEEGVDAFELFHAIHFKEWPKVRKLLKRGGQQAICEPLVIKAIWEAYEDEKHAQLEPEWVSTIELMTKYVHPDIIYLAGIFIYDPKLLEVLILRGLDPRKRYERGWTLLHASVGSRFGTSCFTDTDKRLIAAALHYGLSINAMDDNGENLFFQVVKNMLNRDELSKLEILVRLGSFVNVKDKDGNTPLHVVSYDQQWLADWLIENGADLTAVNNAGLTPALEAEEKGYIKLALHLHESQKQEKKPLPPHVLQAMQEAKRRVALRALKYEFDPDWIPDSLFDTCWKCSTQFQLLVRRHHCRLCGYLFCKDCTKQWVTIRNKQVRVCDECHELYTEYNDHPIKKLRDEELKSCLGLSHKGVSTRKTKHQRKKSKGKRSNPQRKKKKKRKKSQKKEDGHKADLQSHEEAQEEEEKSNNTEEANDEKGETKAEEPQEQEGQEEGTERETPKQRRKAAKEEDEKDNNKGRKKKKKKKKKKLKKENEAETKTESGTNKKKNKKKRSQEQEEQVQL